MPEYRHLLRLSPARLGARFVNTNRELPDDGTRRFDGSILPHAHLVQIYDRTEALLASLLRKRHNEGIPFSVTGKRETQRKKENTALIFLSLPRSP